MLKTSISTGGVRKLTEDEKAILAHPGSRAFVTYFSIMCFCGFLYLLFAKISIALTFMVGAAVFIGGALAILGFILSMGQEKVIKYDPAFEAIDPAMQEHINKIQRNAHRKLMKQGYILMPFILFVFAAPIIGTIVLVSTLSAADGGGEVNAGKALFSIACFAYFILFIIFALIASIRSGSKPKAQSKEDIVETEGVVYSLITAFERTDSKKYRFQIAVLESDEFLIAFSTNGNYGKGEKIRVQFNKNNLPRCTIVE